MRINPDSIYRKVPVTALAFIHSQIVSATNKDNSSYHALLVANGGSLQIYNTKLSKCVAETNVLGISRIYGIEVLSTAVSVEPAAKSETVKVLVFGSKSWAVATIAGSFNECNIQIKMLAQYNTMDWIKAAHWVEDPASSQNLVALATAHNKVLVLDPSSGTLLHQAQNSEPCILYAARFHGQTIHDLTIAAGTVFNQVLIWKVFPSDNTFDPHGAGNDALVETRLCGHEGVIFNVRFSSDGSEICSVSDDRTIRLWKADSGTQTAVLYGHQARIWDCLVLDSYLVSASEDGTCRVWDRTDNNNATPTTVDSWRQCSKNVWSIASDPSASMVASGGSDGSVYLRPLVTAKSRHVGSVDDLAQITLPKSLSHMGPDGDKPDVNEHLRNFGLTCSGSTLVTTQMGYVLKCSANDEPWTTILHSPSLENYSMVSSSLCGKVVAIGALDGSVTVINATVESLYSTFKLHNTSVRFLKLISCSPTSDGLLSFELITSDVRDCVMWSRITVTNDSIDCVLMATINVPHPTRFATASIDASLGWAAVGSVQGGLFIYDVPKAISGHKVDEGASNTPALEPCVVWYQAHGKYTVSTILIQPAPSTTISDNSCTIITGGRDGNYEKFSIEANSTNVQDTHIPLSRQKVKHGNGMTQKSMYIGKLQNSTSASEKSVVVSRILHEKLTKGWVEDLIQTKDQLLAVTFYRQRMVLIDLASETNILSVVCGGANRLWSILVAEDKGVQFGFIHKSALHLYSSPISLRSHSHDSKILTHGISSTEIRAVSSTKLSPEKDNDCVLLAMGGEDCHLHIHKLDTTRVNLTTLLSAKRHSSSIRCLEFAKTPESKYTYLFTAGSCCELRCWRIDVNGTCVEWALAPTVESESDTRIMDIAVINQQDAPNDTYLLVAAVYSDSAIRLWRLDIAAHSFICVAHDEEYTHNHCILSVLHVQMDILSRTRDVLISAATDGCVGLWDITDSIRVESSNNLTATLEPPLLLQNYVHQSGINAMAVYKTSKNRILVASGGDDNALTVCEFSSDSSKTATLCLSAIGRCECAHASTIQSVMFVASNEICSVSTDQRVATWHLERNNDCIEIVLDSMVYSQVVDPSCACIFNISDSYNAVAVCGIGTEIFSTE